MAETPISPDLAHFISGHIHSVEQLEVLSLLVENPSKLWSVQEIFRCIQSTEKSVLQSLEYFVKHQLAVTNSQGLFRFPPEGSEITRCASVLVATYRERRVATIELIYSKPVDPVRHFAEAFRLRKDK